MTDLYDFRAPGFTPDEYNSLHLRETAGPMGGLALKETAEWAMAEIRTRVPDIGDTEIIVYDGDLYIVGDYIRKLSSTRTYGSGSR